MFSQINAVRAREANLWAAVAVRGKNSESYEALCRVPVGACDNEVINCASALSNRL